MNHEYDPLPVLIALAAASFRTGWLATGRFRPIALVVWLVSASSACTGPDVPTQDVHRDGRVTNVLPSWNPGPAREVIKSFVARVTTPGGTDFVPEAERIAVFDNDGTLWSEQPAYFQLLFAMDRVRAMSSDHPEWEH